MPIPSNPGWKFGYVPSPGEWNNTFAGKVDYPAPLSQGGTGGQDSYGGNYNLQQRVEISTPTQAAAALTFYSVRTDETAVTIALPPASACQPGDWIDIFDSGANAAVNNITINASGTDTISHNGTAAGSLLLQNNGARCILAVDGTSVWRAQVVSQSTGIGLAAGAIRTLTSSATVDVSYVGDLCKVSGAGVSIILPDSGFIAGNAIAFDNVDPLNAISFTVPAGDAPVTLFPSDCVIVVSDGAGGWWKTSYYTSIPVTAQPIPQQIADTAYTIQAQDAGQYLQFTSASAVTVTVPARATLPLPIGCVIVIEQYDAGQVTLVGDTGVTLNGHNGLKTGGKFAVVQLKNGSNGSPDIWTVLGDATT